MKRANEIVKQNGRTKSEQDGGPVIFFFSRRRCISRNEIILYTVFVFRVKSAVFVPLEFVIKFRSYCFLSAVGIGSFCFCQSFSRIFGRDISRT